MSVIGLRVCEDVGEYLVMSERLYLMADSLNILRTPGYESSGLLRTSQGASGGYTLC